MSKHSYKKVRLTFWTMCIGILLALSPQAMAKSGKAGKKSHNKVDGGKLDVSDLEQKYWAPKDTDFGVVQNRTYTKEKKVGIYTNYGPLMNDGYNEGNAFGLGANYFFNERMGVQFDYSRYHLVNSEGVDIFVNQLSAGTAPNFGRPLSYYGVGFNWVPFYAKMSAMGKKIIYFDMMFTPGLGYTKYQQLTHMGVGDKEEQALTFSLDISQIFFLEKWLAVRVDLKSRWFEEQVIDYRNYTSLPSRNIHHIYLMFGAQFFLDGDTIKNVRKSLFKK